MQIYSKRTSIAKIKENTFGFILGNGGGLQKLII
jgi:hypothetical protein